jgi:hypothetical protein
VDCGMVAEREAGRWVSLRRNRTARVYKYLLSRRTPLLGKKGGFTRSFLKEEFLK